jgi:hypothetical protein
LTNTTLDAEKIAGLIAKAGQASTLATTAGEGGAQTAGAVYEYKAGEAQAKSTSFEGEAQDLDFYIQQMVDAYKEALAGGGVLTAFSKQMQSQFSTLGGIFGNIA